jgi:hypothetical protein
MRSPSGQLEYRGEAMQPIVLKRAGKGPRKRGPRVAYPKLNVRTSTETDGRGLELELHERALSNLPWVRDILTIEDIKKSFAALKDQQIRCAGVIDQVVA